jgi:hypothetical protein
MMVHDHQVELRAPRSGGSEVSHVCTFETCRLIQGMSANQGMPGRERPTVNVTRSTRFGGRPPGGNVLSRKPLTCSVETQLRRGN